MVGVAQLVEPRIVIPVVVGSNPIVHPISFCFQNNIYPSGLFISPDALGASLRLALRAASLCSAVPTRCVIPVVVFEKMQSIFKRAKGEAHSDMMP